MSEHTITRAEVTDALVRKVGLSRQESADILDRTLELIGGALEISGTVKLSKFGNFVVRKKKVRKGRNPKTGIEAIISARNVVTFRPSPKLKARVNGT